MLLNWCFQHSYKSCLQPFSPLSFGVPREKALPTCSPVHLKPSSSCWIKKTQARCWAERHGEEEEKEMRRIPVLTSSLPFSLSLLFFFNVVFFSFLLLLLHRSRCQDLNFVWQLSERAGIEERRKATITSLFDVCSKNSSLNMDAI